MKFFTLFFFVLVFTFVSLYESTTPEIPKTKMKKAMIGFDKKYFYKIKSKPYMKKLKKALFVSASWEEFIKPLIYIIRGFGLDKCASFPSIEAKRSDEEED